jgi:hypothetical protein
MKHVPNSSLFAVDLSETQASQEKKGEKKKKQKFAGNFFAAASKIRPSKQHDSAE